MGKIEVSVTGYVCSIVIDNPPLNALDRELVEALKGAFAGIDAEKVRAVVLSGAGGRAFVAGGDISQFPALDAESGIAFVRHGQLVMQEIANFPLPVICAIEGFALGGGLELALACDIRVASEKSKFGVPEATLGICPGYGGTQRLPRLVGAGMAKLMMLTGEYFTAQQAQAMGLCEVVVPAGQAVEEALALAEKIATKTAPVSARVVKRLVAEGSELPLEKAVELEAELFGTLCETEDKNEGVQAFFDKRPAQFQGR